MPTAYVMSFVAIVLSFVVHVHATVSATAPIPFPCVAYQPSTEHGVTHSHPRFMAVGVETTGSNQSDQNPLYEITRDTTAIKGIRCAPRWLQPIWFKL
ncbi:hypothetical protein B0H16DRAFT_640381 [Mycena metata]|uniref:Secreted protein n=1 Tax=Mycena metata TaxID=1033252 RepID=A0AAD7H1P1_9AGAR|nr:hypothetical protein B0H16DRAFT_640381 [Mycena metata]